MGVGVTGRKAMREAWQNSAIRSALAHSYRWLRHVPERLAHPSRRARARALVAATPPPRQILYICLGNVCRSPYAEVASRRDAARWTSPPPAWVSAGFIGPDRPSPELAREVAVERGAPLDSHRSQIVSRELVETSDLIVVMEAYQANELGLQFGRRRGVVILGDLDPRPITTRTITDPWNKSRDVFVASYERIDRCLVALAEWVGPEGSS